MTFTLIHCWVIAAIIALIECWMKKWQKGDGFVMIPFFCFKTSSITFFFGLLMY